MAQRLQERQSSAFCVDASNRHLRLCAQLPGTQPLIDALQPCIASVVTKQIALDTANTEKNCAYDLTQFVDTELDNAVRSSAARSMEYDRNTPGARTYEMLFPQNTRPIIENYHLTESAEVLKLIARFATLPENHPLRAEIEKLQAVVTKSEKTVQEYYDSIKRQATAGAELNIAKAKLVRQYTANIFDAEKVFGRKLSDKLFPEIVTRRDKSSETAVDEPAAETNPN